MIIFCFVKLAEKRVVLSLIPVQPQIVLLPFDNLVNKPKTKHSIIKNRSAHLMFYKVRRSFRDRIRHAFTTLNSRAVVLYQ